MIKKNIIIALISVAVFVYVLWDVTDYVRTKQEQRKQNAITLDAADINDCIINATKSGRLTKLQAAKYCDCFMTYIKGKYTREQMKNSADSILNVELVKIKECAEESLR